MKLFVHTGGIPGCIGLRKIHTYSPINATNIGDHRASNLTFVSARLEIKVATVSLNARAANEASGSNGGKH